MPDAQQSAAVLHGLIRLSGMSIALPAAAIREVVPRPDELIPFPALIPEVSGAIALRGQIIPVLDLERLLSPSAPARPGSGKIVVVLRHGDLVHGIEAEAIEGVAALGADALGRLEIAPTDPAQKLVRATFVQPDMAGIVIDPAALRDLPGLPMVDDLAGHDPDRQKNVEPTLIFRIGALRYALPAACVDASLPTQKLLPAPVPDDLWTAMLRHNGMEIPVVDTLTLLQQGSLGKRAKGSAVVLRTSALETGGFSGTPADFGLVALLIDAVEDIVRLEPGMTAPLQGELPHTPFVKGIAGLECGPCLMLDGEQMGRDPRLAKLGAIKQTAAHDSSAEPATRAATALASEADRTARAPYLVFTVGDNSFAAPLGVIDEILLEDEALIPLQSASHVIRGFLSRRGRTVPVLDLAAALGEAGGNPEKFLVITRLDCPGCPDRIGFAVDALRSVERAAVQKLGPGTPAPTRCQLGLLEATIRLEDGKACGILDLQQLALSQLNNRHAA